MNKNKKKDDDNEFSIASKSEVVSLNKPLSNPVNKVEEVKKVETITPSSQSS
jgi:hypothetical protein